MSALTFVPLGGSNEIGMNLNVYGHDGRWLVVDCGIGFEAIGPGDTKVWLPDPAFLAQQPDAVAGLVITHVHMDHLGAVADLWPRLRCPIWCTPFAAAVLRGRLRESGLVHRVEIHERLPGDRFDVGPFDVEFVGLTHSTVEMVGLVLRAGGTTVFHTGDFKLDPRPGLGPLSDLATLELVGAEGVQVCISDSTNATRGGWSASEGTVEERLRELIAARTGRVAVGVFSSNIARMAALLRLAQEHERSTVVVGRSLHRMLQAAREAGYLRTVPDPVSPREARLLPRERVLMLCTGTQAEPGSTLYRLAHGGHPDAVLEEGDTVIFSSKVIPGNEEEIERLHRAFEAQRIEVVHELDDPAVHASGHPCRDELAALYAALRPAVVVPVHGTPRHLEAHADWARALGLEATQVRNGDVLHLGPGPVRQVGTVPAGRIPREAMQRRR
ncbi:MAG: ribonuclease J [Alphaproteobacteria bacterium]|nr:ribonuclease J [Alphaproteobacteria bacterium]